MTPLSDQAITDLEAAGYRVIGQEDDRVLLKPIEGREKTALLPGLSLGSMKPEIPLIEALYADMKAMDDLCPPKRYRTRSLGQRQPWREKAEAARERRCQSR